ncbi:hypothetical protein BU198_25485 [Streptomyces sp. CBMA156]|nr:hypothetical protein [Streptomyces sp. CBMA156]
MRAGVGLVNAKGATLRSLMEPRAEELFPMMFTMSADGYELRRSPVRRGIKPPSDRRTLQG